MIKTLFVLGILFTTCALNLTAQTIINPQAGISVQSVNGEPDSTETQAYIGYTIGADARFGNRFYFQPGLFFSQSSTEYSTIDSNLTVDDVKSKFNRTIFTIKTLAGFDIIHRDVLKIRLIAGPTVDFITKTEGADGTVNKSDYNSTVFNARVGLGIDIWFITLDFDYSIGLTDAFSSTTNFDTSKFNTLYVTLGVAFGNGMKKK